LNEKTLTENLLSLYKEKEKLAQYEANKTALLERLHSFSGQ